MGIDKERAATLVRQKLGDAAGSVLSWLQDQDTESWIIKATDSNAVILGFIEDRSRAGETTQAREVS